MKHQGDKHRVHQEKRLRARVRPKSYKCVKNFCFSIEQNTKGYMSPCIYGIRQSCFTSKQVTDLMVK